MTIKTWTDQKFRKKKCQKRHSKFRIEFLLKIRRKKAPNCKKIERNQKFHPLFSQKTSNHPKNPNFSIYDDKKVSKSKRSKENHVRWSERLKKYVNSNWRQEKNEKVATGQASLGRRFRGRNCVAIVDTERRTIKGAGDVAAGKPSRNSEALGTLSTRVYQGMRLLLTPVQRERL